MPSPAAHSMADVCTFWSEGLAHVTRNRYALSAGREAGV